MYLSPCLPPRESPKVSSCFSNFTPTRSRGRVGVTAHCRGTFAMHPGGDSSSLRPRFVAAVLAHLASSCSLYFCLTPFFIVSAYFSRLWQPQSLRLILLSARGEGTREERRTDGRIINTFVRLQFSFHSRPLGPPPPHSSSILPQSLFYSGSFSHKGSLVWNFLTGQIEVSLLPSESESLPPLTVPDFKCIATPPLVSL